ncbi:MAG TPA: M17 family peptidase N-terminal domain-containing protein, partial [Thermodesulfovibrionia bacterium]|nr:M17 family peptidase N-terminal domain-containing protein [Thermodesulfovibrionia bacterium]
MDFKITDQKINDIDCDCIVAGKYEDTPLDGEILQLDQAMDKAITSVIETDDFKGKEGKCIVIYTLGKIKPKRIALVGLGKKDKITLDTFRKAAGTAANSAKEANAKHVGFSLFNHENFSANDAAQAMVEGISLASYCFDRHKEKKDDNQKRIDTVSLLAEKTSEMEKSVKMGAIFSDGVNFARDI